MTTGAGSCAGLGTTGTSTSFCGTGQNCNRFSGFTCWNPINGSAALTLCSGNQFQCVVIKSIYFKIKLNE